MKIQEMFVKPIDRSIEGVIKADANEHLLQEVEEYVLTEEISLKVFDFLDEYNDPQSGNGSWISGFFGSGKSHLLKMLSLLLENHVIEGKETVEYFKPKCNDTLLKGLMDKAAKIPSKSILFNIDQKANITHKKQTDAVLSVFVKVFNEMQGFYGGIDYVAKLESDLHNRGQLDTFKEAIQKITNRPWNEVREESLLEEDSIDQAYAITAGKELKSINGILEKYKDSYKMSIEDFANNVKEYIDKQGKQFRLNFFVDEVGQFIADNVKLMTNLQTIAESLNTKCKGRSWILVTAQDEMDMIVGEISKQQGNDFTKIQARFHNRIKLTSKNVAEVIQKRLLDKTPNAKHNLKNLYQRERENLDTLFRFTDNSRNYESFADEEHFISCYPFIPYQFQMFQSSIEKLSAHNAFEGKYSSVGERSMLGVFQKVGIHLQNYDEGSLATFDTMFEGIRSTLKSSTQRDVITAENNLSHNQFAIKVLKALFLVKYNKEFKPTISNIIVLLIPKFCADLQKLRIQTQEALDLLVQQTYIQRTGDFYEYLTDKEKDIEKEIKNMDITQEERYRLIQELIFNYIPSGKITHKAYHQDFSYTLKIDNSIISRSKEEVSINFVTPLCEDYENKTMFLMPGNAAKEMLLYLPLYKHWVEDVTQYLRTRKFVQSFTQKEETLQHIISKQAEANQKRHKDIQQTFDEMIQEAEIYSRGHESSSPKKNAKDRIIEGFQKLIDSIYRNRDWIGDAQYKEDSILKALNDDALIVSLSQPVKEVLNYINIQDKLATRLTVKQVKDHFSKPPYGWEQYVVLTFLAKLWSSHKIEFSKDHIVQENTKELFNMLKNSRYFDSITVHPQKEYSESQVRTLKQFYRDFTTLPPIDSDAKAIAKATQEAIQDALDKYIEMEKNISNYPFCDTYETAKKDIELISQNDTDWYLTKLNSVKDNILREKDEVLEPIFNFLNGSQKTIFDQIQNFLKTEHDNVEAYLDKPIEIAQLKDVLENKECFLHDCLNKAKNTFTSVHNELDSIKVTEKNKAKENLKELQTSLDNKIIETEEYTNALTRANRILQKTNTIASWHNAVLTFDRVVKDITLPKPPTYDETPPTSPPQTTPEGITVKEPVLEKDLLITYKNDFITNEVESEEYVTALKSSITKELNKGNKISIQRKKQ